MDKRKQPDQLSFDEAKELWNELGNKRDAELETPTEQEKREFHQKLYARIEAHQAKKRRIKTLRYTSLMVAAVLLLIGSVISYRSLYLPDVYQADQHVLTFTLKDGSSVTLSKGAKLTVEKSFPADTREVILEGDAVFNVTKSKIHPFIVHAGSYQTKVLGTIFKITQDHQRFNVDLYEGKVQVIKAEKPTETFVIKPKQTFSNFGSKDVATIVATKTTDTTLKNNTATISFTDLKLMDAIKILEDTYGVKIQYPSTASNSKLSATKEKATAADMIRLISLKLNLNSKKINDKTFQLEE
ncbi:MULTISPECIES: FecR family protein [Chryseobacterium]|uniref:Fec operon regulator FecR n=2 Tax=Chryseobacterium gleum TaxID=250 RepID=A0A448B979_CHRGE|nr:MULTISPECIES: FecR domain-containing protein [Chryseobacterium]EFK36094.1 sigma factor regulatory protein, FecR/PupR family [Chryseobacterium gleum ATCC 35910]QQY31795.1 FecR domain-containing protein [Chryseobacterium gleum]VEE11141.1 fec operon regulator FecR [Chryseobacterium gleum]VFA43980.1 fec operon regulator FecR [Chryseobacterium indologenes]